MKIGYHDEETGEILTEEQVRKVKQEEYSLRIKYLKKRYDKDEITLSEMEELMDKLNISQITKIKYESFYVSNMKLPKPNSISFNDYGRFHSILDYINYDNDIIHSNGKKVTYDKLKDILEFKTKGSVQRYLKKMAEVNLLAITKTNNKTFLSINPIYAQRNTEINSNLYKYFKNDINKYISPYHKKLFELKEKDDKNNLELVSKEPK